jgi:hypothetical protein
MVENMNQGMGGFDMNTGTNTGFYPIQNNNANDYNWGGMGDSSAFPTQIVDQEEENRMLARKKEDDERRAKIVKKTSDEIRIKQEFRDKAREFLENFEQARNKNLQKRQQFNKTNEEEFLQMRKDMKEGKKNPWEKVVENIELKESDYKGSKDVTRMRSVILTRKSDIMIKMK